MFVIYQGLRYIEVRYIEVRYIEVPLIAHLFSFGFFQKIQSFKASNKV